MEPLFITEQEVGELVGPDDAFQAVTNAHRALSSGKTANVVRTRARTPKLSLHTMSAASPECQAAAAKLYTAGPGGVQSHVLLYDLGSGELVAIIEANELGRLRTAAASVVAAKALLENAAVSSLAIIGTGFQAMGIVRAYLSGTGIRLSEVRVFSRKPETRKKFVEDASRQLRAPVRAADSAQQAVEGADIVITATTSSQPVLEHDWLKGCKHLSALGSNSLARRELPPRVVTGAGCIVVDALDAAQAEGGNFLTAIENGKLQWRELYELGDILAKKSKPAKPSGAYSLFCSHGLAIQDLFLAQDIFKRKSARI